VIIDWNFLSCPVCPALLGEPCLSLSGWYGGPVAVATDRPHGGRKPSKAAGRG
jgi:hypothetical protein